MTTVFLVLAALMLAAGARIAVVWWRSRGARVITCPETEQPEAVAIDTAGAVATGLVGRPHVQLSDCSRWPEREGCDQACLRQIENSPDGCLLASRVHEWYAGRDCVFCGKAFAEIHWHDHKPGLRAPDGQLLQWGEVEPARALEVLASHQPVCWNCLMTQGFRERFPEKVIDVPPPTPTRNA